MRVIDLKTYLIVNEFDSEVGAIDCIALSSIDNLILVGG